MKGYFADKKKITGLSAGPSELFSARRHTVKRFNTKHFLVMVLTMATLYFLRNQHFFFGHKTLDVH